MAVQLPDSHADRRRCGYCNGHITDEFRLTYGTQNNRALRCPECDSWPRIQRGSAAGKDVDRPDPQENPGRTGGRTLRSNAEVVADGGERP